MGRIESEGGSSDLSLGSLACVRSAELAKLSCDYTEWREREREERERVSEKERECMRVSEREKEAGRKKEERRERGDRIKMGTHYLHYLHVQY